MNGNNFDFFLHFNSEKTSLHIAGNMFQKKIVRTEKRNESI
jgi:hypothetical protein